MPGLCKYKNAAGKPGEGAHAWRIGGVKGSRDGIAGSDLLLTAGAAFLLSRVTFKSYGALASFFIVFIILMILAVAVHRLFCVDTALNRKLGLTGPQSKLKPPAASSGPTPPTPPSVPTATRCAPVATAPTGRAPQPASPRPPSSPGE